MTHRIRPQTSGQAHPKPGLHPLPAPLAEVALIDAKTCTAPGQVSLSWWYCEVAAGRAPQPVIRGPRFTRWRMADVAAFWLARVAQAQETPAVANALLAQTKRASAAAQAKRAAAAAAAL